MKFNQLLHASKVAQMDPMMDPMMGGEPGPPPGAPDSEQQFEQDFARMAFSALEDRAVKLMPHLVAFEVVRKEADGTAAIGMFGFDIGNKFYYIPAFFRNGRVADIDIILDKEENVMMPLQESNIAKLLNQELVTLGDATRVPQGRSNHLENPNLDFVADPPMFKQASDTRQVYRKGPYFVYNTGPRSKSASDSFDTEWSGQLKEAFEHMQQRASTAIKEYPELFGPVFSKVAGVDNGQPESELKAFLAQAGPGATNCVLKTAGTHPDFAAALYSVYPDIEEIVPEQYAKRKIAGDLWLFEAGQKLPEGLSAEKRAEIYGRGWAIVDKRERTGELNEVDLEETFGTPCEAGKYKVYLQGGHTDECLVVPYQGGIAVVSGDGEQSFTASPENLCVQLNSMQPLGDAGISVKEIKPGRKYVLAHPSADDGYVFECEAVEEKDGGEIAASIWTCRYAEYGERTIGKHQTPSALCTVDYESKDCTLSRSPGSSDYMLYVPSDWRAVELNKAAREERDAAKSEYEKEFDADQATPVASIKFRPGTHPIMD